MGDNAMTLADITSASWSVALDRAAGRGPGGGIGRVVQGLDDIDQCVQIILSTLPGEDPFRPEFGVDLTVFLDRPLAALVPAIVGVVSQAIQRWEPRVSVLGVYATSVGPSAPGAMKIDVRWQIDDGQAGASSGARIGALTPRMTTATVA